MNYTDNTEDAEGILKSYNEINLPPAKHRFNTDYVAKNRHYKQLMQMGRLLPSCKSQAQFFIRFNCELDMLNAADVERIENLLNTYSYKGVYRYTRSKRWVRLINQKDLRDAIYRQFIQDKKGEEK